MFLLTQTQTLALILQEKVEFRILLCPEGISAIHTENDLVHSPRATTIVTTAATRPGDDLLLDEGGDGIVGVHQCRPLPPEAVRQLLREQEHVEQRLERLGAGVRLECPH